MKFASVTAAAHKLQFQSNLNILDSWSEKWQMKLNVDKLKFCVSVTIINT